MMRRACAVLVAAAALCCPVAMPAAQEQLVVTVVSDDEVRVADTIVPFGEALERLRRRHGERRGPQPLLGLQKCPKASTAAFKGILDSLQATRLYLVPVEFNEPDPRRCTD